MTASTVVARLAWRLVVAAAVAAWALLAVCLAVVDVGSVVDAVTGGVTP